MTWHVGIDPASCNVGLAAIHDADGTLRHTCLHATGEWQDRLVWIRREVRAWLSPLADDGIWCVVIERPTTRHGGTLLLGAFGVIVEGVRALLPDVAVHELGSGSWKRIALGDGAAKKQDVMAAARRLGYRGAWQDTADAVCCAEAARVLTRRALGREEVA